jgi:S1-C subfamily serine protease
MSNPNSGVPEGEGLHAFSESLADVVARIAPSIVAVHARRRIPASGVVWRPGYVVMSDHTLRRDRDITVTLEDGRSVAATIVGRDASTDLALLKLADDTVPAATHVGGASLVRAGQIVLAIGRPGAKVTATLGTIHTVGAEWRTWQGGQLSELVRADIEIHDGFSGSALVDTQGHIIGINSSILTRGAPATIPVVTVNRVVDQLMAGGHIPRGWLGVGTQPIRIPERVRTEASLAQEVGLLVVNVASDSPAERAGMFVGDTLLSLAGTATREAEDVLAILGPDTVGKTLTARLVRAGAVIELPVTIGSSPGAGRRGPHGGGGGGWGGFGDRPGAGADGSGREQRDSEHRQHHRSDHHQREHRHGQARPENEMCGTFADFGEAFALGWARGFGPRRPH